MARVLDAVRVLSAGVEFTTDDLREAGLPDPPEPRAYGAAMRVVQREGLAQPTDRMRASARAACHARPQRVWRRAG